MRSLFPKALRVAVAVIGLFGLLGPMYLTQTYAACGGLSSHDVAQVLGVAAVNAEVSREDGPRTVCSFTVAGSHHPFGQRLGQPITLLLFDGPGYMVDQIANGADRRPTTIPGADQAAISSTPQGSQLQISGAGRTAIILVTAPPHGTEADPQRMARDLGAMLARRWLDS